MEAFTGHHPLHGHDDHHHHAYGGGGPYQHHYGGGVPVPLRMRGWVWYVGIGAVVLVLIVVGAVFLPKLWDRVFPCERYKTQKQAKCSDVGDAFGQPCETEGNPKACCYAELNRAQYGTKPTYTCDKVCSDRYSRAGNGKDDSGFCYHNGNETGRCLCGPKLS